MMLLRLASALMLALGVGQADLLHVYGDLPPPAVKPDQVLYYPVSADGSRVFSNALAQSARNKTLAVIVFGADWCHDSRSLAKVLTSEDFRSQFDGRYEVTFINVGRPQTGEGVNLDLVKRLGVKDLKSTPALFVLRPDGKLLNGKKDAVSWRNAESRGTGKVLAWFRGFDKR